MATPAALVSARTGCRRSSRRAGRVSGRARRHGYGGRYWSRLVPSLDQPVNRTSSGRPAPRFAAPPSCCRRHQGRHRCRIGIECRGGSGGGLPGVRVGRHPRQLHHRRLGGPHPAVGGEPTGGRAGASPRRAPVRPHLAQRHAHSVRAGHARLGPADRGPGGGHGTRRRAGPAAPVPAGDLRAPVAGSAGRRGSPARPAPGAGTGGEPAERARLRERHEVRVCVPADEAAWRVPLGLAGGTDPGVELVRLETLRPSRAGSGSRRRTTCRTCATR